MSSDSLKHLWQVHVTNLETRIAVGIHPHERKKQRIIINATVEGEYPTEPKVIGDCFNYEKIHSLVVDEWPKHGHKLLLENCVVELLTHIFRCDNRVERASVRICKPDISKHAEAVGVEARWTRADFVRLSNK